MATRSGLLPYFMPAAQCRHTFFVGTIGSGLYLCSKSEGHSGAHLHLDETPIPVNPGEYARAIRVWSDRSLVLGRRASGAPRSYRVPRSYRRGEGSTIRLRFRGGEGDSVFRPG